MGRFSEKTAITTISSDDIIPCTDISESSDDKKVTFGQISDFAATNDSVVNITENQSIGGEKTFTDGVAFAKGNISYGQSTSLPTGVGSYIASYVSPTYGARLLGHNGSTYQDLKIGAMPTAGLFSQTLKSDGDIEFGYNVTGQTFNGASISSSGDGDIYLSDDGTYSNPKNITPLGTCSTASATAEKVVTLGVPSLTNGLTFLVDFDNANTSSTITLNVDTLGAKNIVDKLGTQITGTLFANRTNERCLFRYDSTLNAFELINADFWSSRMSMPAASYISLTLGATSSTYTAPADGYLLLDKNASAVGQYVYLYITAGIEDICWSVGATNQLIACIPMLKGQVAHYLYVAAGNTNRFQFIYTEGSKP